MKFKRNGDVKETLLLQIPSGKIYPMHSRTSSNASSLASSRLVPVTIQNVAVDDLDTDEEGLGYTHTLVSQ